MEVPDAGGGEGFGVEFGQAVGRESPQVEAVGAQSEIERGSVEGYFAAKFEAGGIDFVNVAGGQGPDRGEGGVADDVGGVAIDSNVTGDGEGG